MFLVIAILLLLFAPSPWNLIGLLGGLALFLGELVFWKRRLRHQPLHVGADTLIGRSATVVRACEPAGQVRIVGAAEVWEARCDAGAPVGATVRVAGREGLMLIVEPSPDA